LHPQLDWQWRWELSVADRETQMNVVRRLQALVDRYHSEGGGPVSHASFALAQSWLVAAARGDAGPPDRLSIGEGEVICAEWVRGYSVDEYEFRPDGVIDVCSWSRTSEEDSGVFSHSSFMAIAPEYPHHSADLAHARTRATSPRYDISGAQLYEAA
jgi:hypothetical protein